MPKSKLSVFLSLLLVFFSGAVLGAFAYRLYMVKSVLSTGVAAAPNRRPDPEEFLRQRLAEKRDQVKVDDQQLQQIQQIYEQTREQFGQIHKKMSEQSRAIDANQVAKIKSVLRPDQIPLYDQLRARHEADRKRDAERKQRREPPTK